MFYFISPNVLLFNSSYIISSSYEKTTSNAGTAAPHSVTHKAINPLDVCKQLLPSFRRTHKDLLQSETALQGMKTELMDAATQVMALPTGTAKKSAEKMIATCRANLGEELEKKQAEGAVSNACLGAMQKDDVVPLGDSGHAYLAVFIQVLQNAQSDTTVKDAISAFAQQIVSVQARYASQKSGKREAKQQSPVQARPQPRRLINYQRKTSRSRIR